MSKLTTAEKQTAQKEINICYTRLQNTLQALQVKNKYFDTLKELKLACYAYSEILRISEGCVSWKNASFAKLSLHISRLGRYFHTLEDIQTLKLLDSLSEVPEVLADVCYTKALVNSYSEVLRLSKLLYEAVKDAASVYELEPLIKPLRVELYKIYRAYKKKI